MSIRPGLTERLQWMQENVYVFYGNMGQATSELNKRETLLANGGRLPSGYAFEKWDRAKREALENFIQKHRDAGTDPLGEDGSQP